MLEHVTTLRKKINALIVFRVIFVTLLLGASFLFKGYEEFINLKLLSYLIISLYIVTIIYSLLIKKVKNLVIFAYAQLIIDVFFGMFLIYITGGIESWFSFTLILTVISSSIVLNKRAGYVISTVSSILYGTFINFQYYGVIHFNIGMTAEKNYLYNVFVHIISFYLTAYLSGYLSSRLEKAEQKIEEKDINLRDLEFFNKEVIENLPSGLFTTDTDGNVLIFNRAAEKITGVDRISIVGKKIDSVLPFFKFPFLEGRKEEQMLINDTQRIIGLNICALRSINEVDDRGFIVIFQDLTEFKRLEAEMKQKEKWATIGELSSNIAHEIKNPLASLRGSIEILKEDTVVGPYKDKLMDIALNEMDRLDKIITDFLIYSRPSQLEVKRFNLHELLDDTLELFKSSEQKKGYVTVKKNYNGILEINADPQKMRQVFWNLALNAIEAMPEGGELIVSTRNMGDKIGISFRDSGIGIKEDDLEKIFYPFYTTKDYGTGLGLAIAYKIIEEHKGRMNVDSGPGLGTTFEIILPRTDGKK
ncbi:MAG: ATP-binding protein [Nitrospirota bacterium]